MNSLKMTFQKGPFIIILMTMVLYLSGFFVFLTPLPILFYALKGNKHIFSRVVVPCLALVIILYISALPSLYTFFQKTPQWSWLISVPGINFLELATHQSVTVFGIAYFLFFIGVSYIIFKVLSDPESVSFFHLKTGALFLFVLIISFYIIYSYGIGVSPLEFIQHYFTMALDEFISLQKDSGLSSDQLAYLKQNESQFIQYSVFLTPAFLFCTVLLVLILNLVISRKIFSPFIERLRDIKLNQWSFPFYGVWLVIFSISMLLVNSYYLHLGYLMVLGANLLIVLLFVYYLQGLTIIFYFLDKKNVRPFIRLMIYALIIILFQTVGLLIVGVGFFDSWFDYRKLVPSPKA